jgi:beta-glucosidase
MGESNSNAGSGLYQYPFQDPDLPVETRIDNLVSLLTTEEKIRCLSTSPSVPRLGIRGSAHVEGLHGLALGGPGNWGKNDPIPTTTFPQAIGLAATWDPELVRQVAAVEGYEARYAFQNPSLNRGGLVVRAPNADLGRDPRWGRTEECYGEDPFFNGVLACAFVRGLHGEHPKYWCAAALLKHFLANSNEDERVSSSSDFDERLFYEYYSVPFRMAIVEAGARAFMAAYNKYNGIPCTTHPVLKDVTVNQWNQDGIICTDGGAFQLLVTAHKYYPNLAVAAGECIRAGITQFLDDYSSSVSESLALGLISLADIESSIRGNFRVMLRLGLLDPPNRVPFSEIGTRGEPEPWLSDENKALVRLVTQKSIVLLKNARNLLPLTPGKVKSIVVAGGLADRVLFDWYSGTAPYVVTPLDGIRERLKGTETHVRCATNNDRSLAVHLARQSELAIIFVGNHPTGDAPWAQVGRLSYGKEAVDRKALELEDQDLIEAVYAVNPNVIVVLVSSFPYAIPWLNENVPGILQITHNGQEMGHALADVLFGDFNPGGRLVQTWPESTQQLAPRLEYDIRKGGTYLYSKQKPLYPFGYGLSYTSFAYSNLRVTPETLMRDGSLSVEVDVKNVGNSLGDDVVQVYVRYPDTRLIRPNLELKGFTRFTLRAAESKRVGVQIPASRLAYWNTERQSFVVESGRLEVIVARNALEHVLNTVVRVQGDQRS